MTFLPALFLTLAAGISPAFANPACIVCTVAVGASLEIARKLGIRDDIVGLWAGALLSLLGYWTIFYFERKHWRFPGRDVLLMGLSIAVIGFMYRDDLLYMPRPVLGFLYLDPFLFSVLAGAALFIGSQKFYSRLKERNGGRAHFPFEKVVLPLLFLTAASVVITCYPL